MSLILGTFFFSIGSALLPILNVEAYLAVVAAKTDSFANWQLALVGGVGQVVGKILWYYAGWHSMNLRWMRKKMESEKWQASYARWHQRIVGRPVFAGTIAFASALLGFPPLAIIAVLAGSLRMNFGVFVVTCLVGRTLRFWAVLAGVGVIFHH